MKSIGTRVRRDLDSELKAAIERLETKAEITADDLTRFRRLLPPGPQQAELDANALLSTWGDLYEYVSGTDCQSVYWRVRPGRSEPRSAADLEARRRVPEAGPPATDREDTVDRVGNEIPTSPAAVAEAIEGTGQDIGGAPSRGERVLDRRHWLVIVRG